MMEAVISGIKAARFTKDFYWFQNEPSENFQMCVFGERCWAWRKHKLTMCQSKEQSWGRGLGRTGAQQGGCSMGGWGPQLLLPCLTSSGHQPQATATNGGRTVSHPSALAPSLFLFHFHRDHIENPDLVDAWIHGCFSAQSWIHARMHARFQALYWAALSTKLTQ